MIRIAAGEKERDMRERGKFMKIRKPELRITRFDSGDVISTSGAGLGFTRLPVADYTYYESISPRYITWKTEIDESRGITTYGDRTRGISGITEDGSATPGGNPTNDWLYTWFNGPDKGWYTENKTLQSYYDAGYTYDTIRKDNSTN
jgi:hypothetical protein